jgi:general stress protein 26
MIEKAKRLLGQGKPVFLITAGEDGRPDARAMSAVQVKSLTRIWMLTGKSSDKYRELVKRPECMLYATELEHGPDYLELRLWGRMELLDDAASRALAWRDEYLDYFPGGKDDPNVCVLKFTADSGMLQSLAGKEKLTL